MRTCTVCSHADRIAVDADLLSGEPLSVTARRYGLHRDAIRRHARSHLSVDEYERLPSSETLPVGELAERVRNVADALLDARLDAAERGNLQNLTRAAIAEIRALDTLTTRLGIDDDSTVTALAEGQALARAVLHAIRRHPEIGPEIASELDMRGHRKLAGAIRAIPATPATPALEEITL